MVDAKKTGSPRQIAQSLIGVAETLEKLPQLFTLDLHIQHTVISDGQSNGLVIESKKLGSIKEIVETLRDSATALSQMSNDFVIESHIKTSVKVNRG
jgi:hypothetical protein